MRSFQILAQNHRTAFAAAICGLLVSPISLGAQSRAYSARDAQVFINGYCSNCHNDDRKRGGLSLDDFDVTHPEKDDATAEKMIRKLRAGMMPPPNAKRPPEAELNAYVSGLESRVDRAAALHPFAGFMAVHRMTRLEYANSVRALLDVDVDTNKLLPADDLSHGFNNISDAQTLSPALLEDYIHAAQKISLLAVGDPTATPSTTTYRLPRVISQTAHIDGTPFGTRGGIAVVHNFPADGEYTFKIAFYTHQQGYLFGQTQAKG